MLKRGIALVTGGTGFVGANLVRRLMNDGWETHVLARPNSDLSMLADVTAAIQVHIHDGSTERLIAIMQQASPQIVFHLASLFRAHHTPQDIEPLIHSNLLVFVVLPRSPCVN